MDQSNNQRILQTPTHRVLHADGVFFTSNGAENAVGLIEN
jgi:hypothetical protein